jgi:hypothetical protein
MRNHYSKYEITKGSYSLVPCRRKGAGEEGAMRDTGYGLVACSGFFGIIPVFENCAGCLLAGDPAASRIFALSARPPSTPLFQPPIRDVEWEDL